MNGRDFFFFFSENLPPKASTFLLSLKCMKILKSKRPLSVLWLRMSFLRIKHSLVEMPMDRFLCSGRDLHSVGHLSGNCERHVYPQRSENLVLLHEASSLTVASVLVRVGWPLSRCCHPLTLEIVAYLEDTGQGVDGGYTESEVSFYATPCDKPHHTLFSYLLNNKYVSCFYTLL